MSIKTPMDELIELVNRDLEPIGATATYHPITLNIQCEAPRYREADARAIIHTAIQKMLVFKWYPEMMNAQRDPKSDAVS